MPTTRNVVTRNKSEQEEMEFIERERKYSDFTDLLTSLEYYLTPLVQHVRIRRPSVVRDLRRCDLLVGCDRLNGRLRRLSGAHSETKTLMGWRESSSAFTMGNGSVVWPSTVSPDNTRILSSCCAKGHAKGQGAHSSLLFRFFQFDQTRCNAPVPEANAMRLCYPSPRPRLQQTLPARHDKIS